MSAAIVTPIVTPIRNQSLYQIEEHLEMLFASEEFIDPNASNAAELREQLAADIREVVKAELAKVDALANYLSWVEHQQAYAASEIDRLERRKRKFANRQARIEEMVIRILQERGKDRLEGRTTYLALHKNPPSLAIEDESAIPIEYKTTIVTSETKIEKDRIKKMLKQNIDVPGCRLVTDRKRLVRG